ncbi:hypothetical protein [Mycobacterium stomatepiae]|uniref:Uncharacterized protein n=1 Tax=Mycobacterium stomatepiae TaxID=470076 RepID=A0A7I7QGM6_9MYCO|nr:hypothetical protein [Mycobacterium stomatepiae]MCV7167826.1 hypothetical protein [Mycobacterium stomatepiae]BBY25290.1 hypothetical protein MSTO_54950 [Mycobacterium stomatepiae]
MKIEATLAGVQFLLALGPAGVAIALVWWARRRRNSGERAPTDESAPHIADAEATATTAKTPVNAAANGHAH